MNKLSSGGEMKHEHKWKVVSSWQVFDNVMIRVECKCGERKDGEINEKSLYRSPVYETSHSIDVNGFCNKGCC